MVDEYIRIRNWPPEHAQKAYDSGFYIEAMQVLHGWIECQARGLLMLVGSVHFNTQFSDTWDAVDQMAYKDVMTALLAVGQLNKQDVDELMTINSTRNKLIHQYFRDPHEKEFSGFPRVEYDRVFSAALTWSDRLLTSRESM
jgi:hypothetical protein